MIRYIINRSKKIEFPGSVCDLFGINFDGNNRNFKAEDILNSILKVYAENYRHFYNNSRARLTEIKSVDSIEKLTTFSQDTARFIVTHPQYLSMAKDGPVKFKSNTYIPRKTLVSSNRKSYDIYENRIVLGFLKYLSNLSTQGEKFKDAMYIKKMISDPNTETERPEFGDVTELTGKFHKMYEKYKKIFNNTADIAVDSLPQMTHIFKNVPHYRDIYKYILLFFAGGAINIPDDDKIRWNLVTSAQIYEYYVFLKLDEALEKDGYVRKEKNPRNNAAFPKYFYYEKGDEKKWLFYQPEIVYIGKPSDINLRRNTKISLGGNAKNEESYTPSYTPDYIIKSIDGSGNETYEIADAKFSDFDTVKDYYLPVAAFKYILSVRGIDNAVIEGMQLYYCKGNPKDDRHPTLEKPYAKIKYLY